MEWNELVVGFFCLLSIVGALSLLFFRNPVNGAVGLLASMASLAGIYALLGAHLLAGFQIIIYAGAIMILIIYIIMLLDEKSDDAKRYFTPGKVIAVGCTVAAAGFLFQFLIGSTSPADGAAEVNYASSVKIAEKLFTDYLFPFEVSSLLLLMAMVGAIALAKKGEY